MKPGLPQPVDRDVVAISATLEPYVYLDWRSTEEGIQAGMEAIKGLLQQANVTASDPDKLKELKPHDLAKLITVVSRAVDDLFRLRQFAKGQPDSRPDMGSGWLQGLTEEQFGQVSRWMEEKAHGREQTPPLR